MMPMTTVFTDSNIVVVTLPKVSYHRMSMRVQVDSQAQPLSSRADIAARKFPP